MDTEKKASIWSRTVTFIKEVKKEVSQVVWPTKRETTITTIVICVFAFVVSLYLLVVDRGLLFIIQSIMS